MSSVLSRAVGTNLRRVVLPGTRRAQMAVGWVLLIGIGIVLTDTNRLWPFVINGISDGAIYSLAAVGLVLTYKTSGVFNFAIGAQAAASAYVFHSFRDTLNWPWPLAAIVTLLTISVASTFVLERMAYWLGEAPPIMRIVATIGILVGLDSLLTGLYGPANIPFTQFLPTDSFRIAGINVQAGQIIVTLIAIVATVALYVFFKRTRWGLSMQAVVEDTGLLSLQAINPTVVRRYAWAIGSAFVSMSGILIAPLVGIDVNLMILLYITAFGAAAIGFFSSLPVTFLAAIAIGILTNVLGYELSTNHDQVIAELYTQVPFLVLVIGLVVLPKRRFIERGARRVRKLPPVRAFAPAAVRGSMVVGLAAAICVPFMVGASRINQYSTGIGFAVVIASLGLVLWTSGQISLCQMAFAAVGAGTFAHAEQAGIPWLLAMLCAALVAIPVGMIVAIPSFRLSGIYLAAATFGFGLLFQNLVYGTFLMFGANETLTARRPKLFGLHTDTDTGYYFVVLTIAVLCLWAIVAVRRNRIGRLLRGLADSPAAMEAHGVDTRVTRLYVFCFSAVLSAIGGALIAGVTQSASGSAEGPFGYFVSLVLVAVLAFCGRWPVFSPIAAAFVYEVIKIYKPFSDAGVMKYEGVVFGLLAIAVAVGPGITGLRVGRRAAQRERPGPVASRMRQRPVQHEVGRVGRRPARRAQRVSS